MSDAPEFENDWHPLQQAFRMALSDERVFLPRECEHRLVAAVIDTLEGENMTLTEADQ